MDSNFIEGFVKTAKTIAQLQVIGAKRAKAIDAGKETICAKGTEKKAMNQNFKQGFEKNATFLRAATRIGKRTLRKGKALGKKAIGYAKKNPGKTVAAGGAAGYIAAPGKKNYEFNF